MTKKGFSNKRMNSGMLLNTNLMNPDPVVERGLKDKPKVKKDVPPAPPKDLYIKPPLDARFGLIAPPLGVPGTKYTPPKTRKELRTIEQRHQKYIDDLHFCERKSEKIPSYGSLYKTQNLKFKAPSAEIKEAKIMPQKPSITPSVLYPEPQKRATLRTHRPKSGTIVNLSRKPTPPPAKKKRRHHRKPKRPPTQEEIFYQMLEEELETINETNEENEMGDFVAPSPLTRQFRRRVSQISKTTSYKREDTRIPIEKGEDELEEELLLTGIEKQERFVQKFTKDEEEERYAPKKTEKPKKGTLENFSDTKIVQPTLKQFYYGIKQGTIHHGDNHFNAPNAQGICMCVAAYCYAIFTHPNRWKTHSIDDILEAGNLLYDESSTAHHKHDNTTKLANTDLLKYCKIGMKKVRFTVGEPEVAGLIRSEDKHVYNLTKAIRIFFASNRKRTAAILETDDRFFLIWYDKNYYFFDSAPRTLDLFVNETEGVATMANFYDQRTIVTVLLERTNLENTPFVIYPLETFKVLALEAEEKDSNEAIPEIENYQMLSETKAVLNGSYDLADKCFGFSRNKQSLTIAIIALVYSKITPAVCWYRKTIDKIVTIGNQLFLECIGNNNEVKHLTVDDLPAHFTLGPYTIEILIVPNQAVDLLYSKGKCQLIKYFETYFEKSTNLIVEIDGLMNLAVFKQRGMYHSFDPYGRNGEATKCTNGTACTSMYTTIEALVETIAANFERKESIFRLHALKIVRIHRDTSAATKCLFPPSQKMADFPIDSFKKQKMSKSRTPTATQNVTVDKGRTATIRPLDDTTTDDDTSIMEVGSNVHSLRSNEVPSMGMKEQALAAAKAATLAALAKLEPPDDIVADLNSPSLSDTQIEPPLMLQELVEGEGFLDADDYALTVEEEEMLTQGEGEGEGAADDVEQLVDLEEEEERMASMGAAEESDWYYTTADCTQIGSGSLLSRISAGVCTDPETFELTYDILPLELPKRVKPRPPRDPILDFAERLDLGPEPAVTLSEELAKETNYVKMPDGCQIVLGSKNLADFCMGEEGEGEEDGVKEDLELVAPFVCVMAGAVAKKYSISTWTKDVVDYVLKCGTDLHATSKIRYDQVYTLEIQRVSLGHTDFRIKVDYKLDADLNRQALQTAILKVLSREHGTSAVLVTPTYSCAILYKNHLYYLFDAFGNNEVGMGKGRGNDGVAAIIRFDDIKELAKRILVNKERREIREHIEFNRFVMSSCTVKVIERLDGDDADVVDDDDDNADYGEEGGKVVVVDPDMPVHTYKKPKPPPEEEKAKIGYQCDDEGLYKIEGTQNAGMGAANSPTLNEDYFTAICALLLRLSTPFKKWNRKKIDMVVMRGREIFDNVDELSVTSKKFIENILMEEYIFNIAAEKVTFTSFRQNKTMERGIKTMLAKKHENFIIQFPNRCYALSVDVAHAPKPRYHLFDPNESKVCPNACWTRYDVLLNLLRRLKSHVVKDGEAYNFHMFDVTSIRRAPKPLRVDPRLRNKYKLMKSSKKPEFLGKDAFHEDISWLKVDPIPWSGKLDKSKLERWSLNWNCELPKPYDLYSLFGCLSPTNEMFTIRENIGNLVVAIGMTQIYELRNWSSKVMDSILMHGDAYFNETIEELKDENYELALEDFNNKCRIFPYVFQLKFTAVVEGTMFLVRLKQFNLFKALRYFFNDFERRFGIICVSTGEEDKRQFAFGKLDEKEYFFYDCCTLGPPMFAEKDSGVPYILRMTKLNRLVHVMTLILRGGDFYIYDVSLSDLKAIDN